MKKWIVIIPVATLIVVGGCEDLPTAESVDEVSAEQLTAQAAVATAVGPARQTSTVCDAFMAQLTELRERIAANPDDAVMQEAAVTFESIIPNTCD
jgi:hypothetical protein